MSIEPVWDQPLDTSALNPSDEVVADKIRSLGSGVKKRRSQIERAEAEASVRIAEMAVRNHFHLASLPSSTVRPGQSLFGDENPLVIGTTLGSSDRWAVSPLTAWADPVLVGDGVEFGNTHLSGQGPTLNKGWEKKTVIFSTFYAIFALPRPVPHIVLDALANDILGSDLPRPFAKSLVIGVDDEFDKAFTTYAPEGAERAVELIFTSKVRDGFLKASTMNVEMVGNALVFFGHDPADFGQPEPWARAVQLQKIVADILPHLGEYVDGGSVLLTPRPRRAMDSNLQTVPIQTLSSSQAPVIMIASISSAAPIVLALIGEGIVPSVPGIAILGGMAIGAASLVTYFIGKRKKIARAQLDSDLR